MALIVAGCCGVFFILAIRKVDRRSDFTGLRFCALAG